MNKLVLATLTVFGLAFGSQCLAKDVVFDDFKQSGRTSYLIMKSFASEKAGTSGFNGGISWHFEQMVSLGIDVGFSGPGGIDLDDAMTASLFYLGPKVGFSYFREKMVFPEFTASIGRGSVTFKQNTETGAEVNHSEITAIDLNLSAMVNMSDRTLLSAGYGYTHVRSKISKATSSSAGEFSTEGLQRASVSLGLHYLFD